MPRATTVQRTFGLQPHMAAVADPCVLVIFGASGDLTKRLLMPAFYNLACDQLLSPNLVIIGIALDDLSTEQFRARMTEDIHQFSTRAAFNEAVWNDLVGRLHYTPGNFSDPAAYQRLTALITQLEEQYQTGGNLLFYLAVPPAVFGLISDQLSQANLTRRPKGWTRLIIEKPFGHDLPSAVALNREVLAHWSEDQVYRIDHYLGKETVQNLLTFRFANGIYEPLWNKNHIDHIQFTVSETVGVERRGKYYDTAGVLRDMIQNHMFQMLAYLCMEVPGSFRAEAIRNEKAKLLEAVRVMTPDEVRQNTVRGQYGPGTKPDGSPAVGYRQEPDVPPQSKTETFAALKLFIDNWRWDGVPIYLRSGKSLWKRETEIVVQFKKAPEVIFRDTPAAGHLASNRLIFHIQPDQGIEFRFLAKVPGPSMQLQKVNMRFDYREAFEAARGTGYEVLLYSCMRGDATLFSRTDLVETAWRIAQPILDVWSSEEPKDFPNYPAGSWGPKAAFDLIERDGRRWVEILNREVLARVPLFVECPPQFLQNLSLMLKPEVFDAGDTIIRRGDPGTEMYFIARGQVEIVDATGKVVSTLKEGDFFGEVSLLRSQPRVNTMRAATPCDLFILDKADFEQAEQEHPEFARMVRAVAERRYPLLDKIP
jgi:glucose-6-phosphate 1-dehydrogenase